MYVVAARQNRGVDLHHRPDHDQLPVGSGLRHGVEQLDVEALVNHAEESETRPGSMT
jgi:hypothetical protein